MSPPIGLGIGVSPSFLGGASAPTPAYTFNLASLSSMPALTSFSRASSATYFDGSGNLQTASTNTPRFDHDFFSNAPLGLLVEGSVANQVRNNTNVGAAAGTPGTLPTNWSINLNSNGLSTSIVNVGTQRGINVIDVRIFGTTTGAGAALVYFEATNVIGAFTWSNSAFLSIVGGSTANVSNISINLDKRDASNVFIAFVSGLNINTNVLTNNLQRFNNASQVGTGGGASFNSPLLNITPSGSGVAVDITIRIGMPQLAAGLLSSVIATSGASVTRAADKPQFTGAAATLIASTQYGIVVTADQYLTNAGAFIGANGADYLGLGYLSGNITTSNGSGISQLSVAGTSFSAIPSVIGLSVAAGKRILTSNGGSIRGGASATDTTNIPMGTYFGTSFNQNFPIVGHISNINLYSAAFTTGQLETAANQIWTTAWGDSLTAGTGSVTPSINYGYCGWLQSISSKPINVQGVGGQSSAQIATRMLAATIGLNDNTIIEAGRNDVGGSIPNLLTNVASMVSHLTPGNTRFVVVAIINSTAENSAASGANLTNYNWVLSANAALAAAYPSNYVDVRSAIVSASGGANDAPPASWMYQGSVHPNDAGYQVMAQTIYNFAHAAGWPGY